MKLHPLAAAVMFGLATSAAWAADTVQSTDDAIQADANQAQAVQDTSATSGVEQVTWPYVNGQAASSKDTDETAQSAKSEEADADEQASMSEDNASGEDQAAASEETAPEDRTAASELRHGSFQPATLEDFKAATQDKLVVILPTGWQGSVPQLLAALENNADAAEVLILSQDEDADANEEEDEDQ